MTRVSLTSAQKIVLQKIKQDKEKFNLFKNELGVLYNIKKSVFPQDLAQYIYLNIQSLFDEIIQNYKLIYVKKKKHKQMDVQIRTRFLNASKNMRNQLKTENIWKRIYLKIELIHLRYQYLNRYTKDVDILKQSYFIECNNFLTKLRSLGAYAQVYEEIILFYSIREKDPYNLMYPNNDVMELKTNNGVKKWIALPITFFNNLLSSLKHSSEEFIELWNQLVYSLVNSYAPSLTPLPFITTASNKDILAFNRVIQPYLKLKEFEQRIITPSFSIENWQTWIQNKQII
ncbi:MAG: hypothetical protein ACXAC7_10630 [Candidatus Hodarchaeales archaeon]|jgi:hypothetical protein